MKIQFTRRILVTSAMFGLALGVTPALAKSGEQQALVDASTKTFNSMMADKDMGWLRQNIRRAKGIIIAPSVVKAGFVFGGSGGNAVFLTRNSKGLTGPAFYKLGTASIGFQAGVSDSEIMMLVMTDKAIKSVLAGNFKVGGEASAAAGPVGAGAKSDINADFITFSHAKGLYGGLNIEGTKIDAHKEWNDAYNGATAAAVLTGQARANPGAANLRAVVKKYAK